MSRRFERVGRVVRKNLSKLIFAHVRVDRVDPVRVADASSIVSGPLSLPIGPKSSNNHS